MTPYRKKLIEVALPLEAINVASAREKSIRHGHPSTLHLWWARRPLAACRAVIFASLVDDPDDPEAHPEFVAACKKLPRGVNAAENDTPRQRLFDFIEQLVTWEATTDEAILEKARELIRLATDGNPPPLLDPFAGGGSIPLEAQRLGLRAYASDLNPVAVMINKALIEIPPRFANLPPVNPRDNSPLSLRGRGAGGEGLWKGAAGLAADVRYYGEWMRNKAWERIGHLYPPYIPPSRGDKSEGILPSGGDKAGFPTSGGDGRGGGETVIAWLWARTVKCPNPACGAQMPLVTSFELSKKKGRKAWVEPIIDRKAKTVQFTVKTGNGQPPDPPKMGRGADFKCMVCGEIAPDAYVKREGVANRMGSKLMAIVTEGNYGRSYYAPTVEHEEVTREASPNWSPQGELSDNTRWFSPPQFGMTKYEDLFTPRQLTALTTFSDLVAEARQQVEADARAIWQSPPPQPSPSGRGSQDSSPQRGEVGRGENIWIPQRVPPQLLEAARRLRKEMTDVEQLLWQCLRRKQLGGFRFRKQHPVERYVLDFYCPAARLAIELDGGQHNTPEGIAHDQERTAFLQERHNIRVIRFWNHEVFQNLEGVLQAIYDALLEAAPMPPPQPSPSWGGSKDSSPQRGEAGWGVPLRDGGTGPKAYAEAVSVYLAFGVSKLPDRNSSLASWDIGSVSLRSTFSRQALPMVWDYCEANPFETMGSFDGAVGWIARALDKLKPSIQGYVWQEDASNITHRHAIPISTDPPYYDNIGYADLSDFFYIWMRKNLREVFPELFGTMLVPKAPELVATPYRFDGDKQAAEQHFESGLMRAFGNMRNIIPPEYPLTVYYAFKQQEIVVEEGAASTGWETMLNGLIETGFSIVGTWPMRTELSNRMIASGTNALASSIVLVCRPRPAEAPMTSRREFVNALRRELPAALREMQSGNIAPVDLAQASIGPGMAVYSRYSKVLEPDGSPLSVRTALQIINHELDAYLAEQEGEMDVDSRFAVAWFEQFGFNEGGFGQADVLARAKNTSVEGMVSAGVLESGAGKTRLLHWSELDPGWDPESDKRLTVWETVHHLIERLNTYGEEGAARLLAKLSPGMAADARQLAYRLYSICERKGWAEQARDYNALVVSWGASQEQARQFKEQYQQGKLL